METLGDFPGLFLSIEGGDGAGKGTQARLTRDWLDRIGYKVTLESFPRYEIPATIPIAQFLNSEYGQLHPNAASALYSLDRLHASPLIREALSETRGIYLADRFTNSNLGHNGSKLSSDEERLRFFEEQRFMEYDALGIPRPDHTYILQVKPEVAQQNVDKKAARSYTNQKRDIHEADAEHLGRTYDTYDLLARTYPNEFTLIDALEPGANKMRSIKDIQSSLQRAIQPLLLEKFGGHQGVLF